MEEPKEAMEEVQARHRKELRELQARVTSKKKNATKKTRKSVNDECAELERQMKDRHLEELSQVTGGGDNSNNNDSGSEADDGADSTPVVVIKTKTAANGGGDAGGAAAINNLAAQLQNTTITPQAAAAAGSKAAKRNRQKERLARRAAEQEAAAVAAESEAATMVDHRSLEKAYMEKEFKKHALREKEIAPDGHCLFSAVADQLAANGISVGTIPTTTTTTTTTTTDNNDNPRAKLPYMVVRRTAADYMEAHTDDFVGFLEEPLGDYVSKIRDTAEWGGQLELTALANAYGVEIRVVQDGRTEVIAPFAAEEEDGKGSKTLWLAYYRHGYGLGEHYNSLRRKDEATATA